MVKTQPQPVHPVLYPYQQQGVSFLLHHGGGLLLDEQGLGKTVQALCAIRALLANPVKYRLESSLGAIIIVCPSVMQGTWKMHVQSILGGFSASVKILIHSYEWYSKPEHLKSVLVSLASSQSANGANAKTAVIVDEAHYIKTPTSIRTRAVLTILEHPSVVFRVLLTGTPITRDIDDLYIPLKVFHSTYCKSIHEFRKRFMRCIHTFFGEKYHGYRSDWAKLYIKDLLNQCALRRTKSSVGLNLPPVVRTPVYIDINQKIAKDSLTLLDYAIRVINGADSYSSTYNTYNTYKTNLEEEANHVATIRKALGIAKVPQVIQYVQTLVDANIPKIIVFAVHVDVVRLIAETLKNKLKSYTIHTITGSTTVAQRDRIIDSFQNESSPPSPPSPQILVANMVACGVGVTLTSAHTVVFAELDFTPANMMQAEARVHRISQKYPVSASYLLANDSLDVKIMSLIKAKMKLIKETL